MAFAADVPPHRPSETSLDLAVSLASEGDIVRAIGEIKRFLYYNPSSPRAREAKVLLADLESAEAAQGLDNAWPPWLASRKPVEDKADAVKDSGPGIAMIRFYQNHLRTFHRPGAVCPSHPNCSEYAVQAIRKHGSILGTFIFVDRYWREVTTVGTPPRVIVNGHEKHYDPLEQNDYWLK